MTKSISAKLSCLSRKGCNVSLKSNWKIGTSHVKPANYFYLSKRFNSEEESVKIYNKAGRSLIGEQVARKEAGYWKDISNQRNFMEEIAEKLNINKAEDWNKVSVQTLTKHGGSGLLNCYHGSIRRLLKTVFKEEEEEKFAFSKRKKESGFWFKLENQRDFILKLKESKNLENIQELKTLTFKDVIESGGRGLLHYFNYNYHLALYTVFPSEFEDLKNSRKNKQKGYWNSLDNQRKFIDNLFSSLHLNDPKNDWVKIEKKDFIHFGGKRIVEIYDRNFLLIFATVYPEFDWRSFNLLQNFTKRKIIITKNKSLIFSPFKPHQKNNEEKKSKLKLENTLNYYIKLLFFQRKFDIKRKEEWYRVGNSFTDNIHEKLQVVHKDQTWQRSKFLIRGKKTIQFYLFTSLRKLYAKSILLEDYHHPLLVKVTNMELDIFIPSLNIAFEYQGEHHFDDMPHSGSIELFKARDFQKSTICENLDIHLILIPYWWDKSITSLASLLPLF